VSPREEQSAAAPGLIEAAERLIVDEQLDELST